MKSSWKYHLSICSLYPPASTHATKQIAKRNPRSSRSSTPLPPQNPPPSLSPNQTLNPLPSPLLAQLLVRRPLQRAHGIALQALVLLLVAHLLRVRAAGRGADLAARGRALLRAGLVLRVGRLSAGVGCGHFFIFF